MTHIRNFMAFGSQIVRELVTHTGPRLRIHYRESFTLKSNHRSHAKERETGGGKLRQQPSRASTQNICPRYVDQNAFHRNAKQEKQRW